MHFLRRLGHLDRRHIRQRLLAPVTQLCLQPGQGLQAAGNATVHQHAEHDAQQQQRGQHVGNQLGGQALLHRQTLGHLDPHALGRTRVAIVHLHQGHAHRFAVHPGVVQQRLVGRSPQLLSRPRQLAVAQQETAGRARHHVAHAVLGILLDDVLRRAGKVNQQARTDRFDLTCQ